LFGGWASAAEPEIRSIAVPPELAAVTSNPELSGVVWSPSLRRYLVVTDDSGLRGKGTNHQPLLLGLSQDGALDKAPILIHGVRGHQRSGIHLRRPRRHLLPGHVALA
jgi:hypothetical protein